MDFRDAAAFADLRPQGVRGDERLGASVEGADAELLNLLVEFPGHDRNLRFGEASDAEGLDGFFHPPG